MFSMQHGIGSGVNMGSGGDYDGYDFTKNENAARWRGLFTPSLKKVLEQVHPRLSAKDDALLYVETLCLRLLAMLCAKPLPHSVQDVEEKVNKSFPAPIDQWALNEAKEIINSKKRKSVLPTDRVHSLLQKDVLQYKIDSSVSVFLVAVLEYISADILKLAGNYVSKIEQCEITKEDIEVVINADTVLMDMFNQSDIKTSVLPSPLSSLPTQRTNSTYEEVVKDLIHDEKQYQRDLHMMIRVFREELVKIVHDPKELEPIFCNIMDIYEVTATLLGSLEDVIEMSQEQNAPCVGSCFEELAEAEEFDVYKKYAQDVTSQASRDALSTLLAKPDALSLMSAGHGFRDAVKYYLPKLLLVPIWHAFVYFEYIKLLMELSASQDDIESFEQVQGLLRPLRSELERIMASLPKELMAPMSSRMRRQLAIEKTRELQVKIEHWEKEVGQNCNEFIREDSLGKLGSGKRIAERKVFLFDGLMVLCKANTKKQTQSTGAPAYDYRLKEKFFMRRVEINDRADTDELKNSFEIAPRVQPSIILTAKNHQHKNDWMADLIMVNTKSMLDRILDSILTDIEKKHPLRMPSPDLYKFAVPDSPKNIVLEERESIGVPLIKGATLCKLVERLTYHIYADPMFVRTFLTTYRYFCSPQNLLSMLIERFNIPDPSLVYQDNQHSGDKDQSLNCDTEKMHKNSQREDWKRYRKEYVQPVQFRVLNVLRHWVDHHFYDFEKDPTLLENLLYFLENINGKSMRKWVDSVLKIVQRKNEQEKSNKKIVYAYGHDPPPIEHHLTVPDAEITLLTLHPLELARQLTLLEFELYKNVKPSELVGSPWTKKDKEVKSPNLLKIMKHTTNVTRWVEKSIIEAENYEERVAMVTRAIEVMMVMLELNNFNGILSISAAMGSASVYRLKLTFQGLPARYEKFLEECRELNDGHLKKYQERLRSINPPCVPFFGRYLTNILHLEEGNPDLLPNTELINFSKRRKVSEIIGEIQQYQNQPYCLKEDPKIRQFLETLDPFKGMSDTDISDHLYHESMRIEPRGCKTPAKFHRKWPTIPLKSPGIKPRRQNNNNNSNKMTVNTYSAQQTNTTNVEHNISCGDQSPTTHISSIGGASGNSNPHAYSVFAIVNIPERNGTTWVSGISAAVAAATGSSGTPVHKADAGVTQSHVGEGGNCDILQTQPPQIVPHLPKKPSAHVWTNNSVSGVSNDTFSPVLPEHNAVMHPPVLPPPPNTSALSSGSVSTLPRHEHRSDTSGWMNMVPDTEQQQQQQLCGSNPFSTNDLNATLPPSPLPKVVVSPRHEPPGNRSPFHNHATTGSHNSNASVHHFGRTSCASIVSSTSVAHFSPTNSIASTTNTINNSGGTIGDISPQLGDFYYNSQTSAGPVPISPHVNVPTASNVEYRTAPPPLPPRRKERTESCADLAQKRQAPDAPTLPPRDGDLSPPPIPPRLNHSTGTLSRSQPKEFVGKNSLLLPNTSSIMIRRNSAIEKRQAAANASNSKAMPQVHLNTSATVLGTTTSTTPLSSSMATAAAAAVSISEDHQLQPQAISPALSSSTTTSPMTPMTPISPHIHTGYQISNDSITSCHHHHHHQHTLRQKPNSTNNSNLHQQQHHYFHHQHPPHPPPVHYQHNQQPNPLANLASSGGSIHPPTRSSPKDYFPLTSDGTPKLPPKPSLSANFYNNPEKGTMFLYPSTNQE